MTVCSNPLPPLSFCPPLLVTLQCRCLPFSVDENHTYFLLRGKSVFPCAHVPKRPIKHIGSFFPTSSVTPQSSHLCVWETNMSPYPSSVWVWWELTRHLSGSVCYRVHTHVSRDPGRPHPFLWTLVAEINSRYACYLSPQGCSPLSGASSELFDEHVTLISFNLCVSFRQSPPVRPPGAICMVSHSVYQWMKADWHCVWQCHQCLKFIL